MTRPFNAPAIDDYLAHLESLGSSEHTVRAYRTDLLGALAAIGPDRPDLEPALAAYLTGNRATWAPKTLLRRLGTVRSWARWAGYGDILADYRRPTPAPPTPHPIPEGIDGIQRMTMSTRNPRHRALCTLIGRMGLRVDEAVNVRPEHFDLTDMVLTIRGKGDKVRRVPVSAEAWKHLERAYKLAVDNGTTLVRLGNRGARAAFTRHGRNAGLSRRVASHDGRATAATCMLEATGDLRAVQEILGHSSVKTTQGYTGVSESRMRRAAESV